MYVFYPDIFFLHNVILIAFISVFSFQLMKIPIREAIKNILLGSVSCAFVETIVLMLSNSYVAFTIVSQLILLPFTLWMELKKYPSISRRRFVVVSYAVVFLFTGASNVLEQVFRFSGGTQIKICGIAILVEGIVLELQRAVQVQKHLFQVEIGNEQQKIYETAFYDSGNCLRDPWKHRAVHIVSESLLQRLKLMEPVLCVPYQSLGNQSGMLEVYEADWLVILSKGKKIRFTNVLLGKAEESLLSNKKYQIILHESVFGNGV